MNWSHSTVRFFLALASIVCGKYSWPRGYARPYKPTASLTWLSSWRQRQDIPKTNNTQSPSWGEETVVIDRLIKHVLHGICFYESRHLWLEFPAAPRTGSSRPTPGWEESVWHLVSVLRWSSDHFRAVENWETRLSIPTTLRLRYFSAKALDALQRHWCSWCLPRWGDCVACRTRARLKGRDAVMICVRIISGTQRRKECVTKMTNMEKNEKHAKQHHKRRQMRIMGMRQNGIMTPRIGTDAFNSKRNMVEE